MKTTLKYILVGVVMFFIGFVTRSEINAKENKASSTQQHGSTAIEETHFGHKYIIFTENGLNCYGYCVLHSPNCSCFKKGK
jgi:hypothetical protein